MKRYTFIIETNLGLETFSVEANNIYEAIDAVNISYKGYIQYNFITKYKITSHCVKSPSVEDLYL